ncbi:MAG: P1 family peptidase, partial [Thermoplasmata archaeon]
MTPREPGRTLTAVRGLRVGTAQDDERGSGVSVVRFDRLSRVVVSVRGPASGTYDTHSLGLEATFGRRHALFLSGGSVYGLDAARGIRT